jgi:hypothetical protein
LLRSAHQGFYQEVVSRSTVRVGVERQEAEMLTSRPAKPAC